MTGIIKSLGINLGKLSEGASTVEVSGETVVGDTDSNKIDTLSVVPESLDTMPDGDQGVEGNVNNVNTVRAAGAATFVVAYAVHKVFAPARIAITLTATPFIVRHLRKIGFLKPPKSKV